jgi:flagellar biosynthesis/type III secretory pathway ATPase
VGEGEADETAALLAHEVDRLGRDELGGHREVTLVLSILVVTDDHHLPLADVLDGVLDGGEC